MAYTIEFETAAIVASADRAADRATALTGLAIEGDTKREAPVRGGYRSFQPPGGRIGGALRRSYTTAAPGTEGSPDGGGDAFGNVKDGALLVGSWLDYPYYVDRGTSQMPPRPHFTPAIAANLPRWTERFRQEFEKETNGRYRG